MKYRLRFEVWLESVLGLGLGVILGTEFSFILKMNIVLEIVCGCFKSSFSVQAVCRVGVVFR